MAPGGKTDNGTGGSVGPWGYSNSDPEQVREPRQPPRQVMVTLAGVTQTA